MVFDNAFCFHIQARGGELGLHVLEERPKEG